MTYYKAVTPQGCSFASSAIRWKVGEVTCHPLPLAHSGDASDYLSVSVVATDCTGMDWPCRLFEVEPVEGFPVWTPHPDDLPNKRAAGAWRVVRELPAHEALGPQGEHVAALVDRARALSVTEARRLYAARAAAAWDAAWVAAWDAAWDAARDAARGAVRALMVRDLISPEHYDELTRPWRVAIGPIHPDDKELSA